MSVASIQTSNHALPSINTKNIFQPKEPTIKINVIYFFSNISYLTKISFNNTAHIQEQILKYIQGSNCELTAKAAREMPTALMSCESLVNSPAPPLAPQVL